MKIFVYGTFKTGHLRNRVLTSYGAEYVSPGIVNNCAIYMAQGGLPVALPHPRLYVKGEVYEVSPKYLGYFDEIEGFPWLYTRAKVDVKTKKGTVKAWMYFGTPHLARKFVSGAKGKTVYGGEEPKVNLADVDSESERVQAEDGLRP